MYSCMKNQTTIRELTDHPMFANHPQHAAYQARIASLEADGLTTSDAQGTADAEYMMGYFDQ